MHAIFAHRIAAASRPGGIAVSIIVLGGAVFAAVVTALASAALLPRWAGLDLPLPLVIHLATVIPAVPLGAYVLLSRKGDRRHRMLGRIWAMLMAVTAIDSFWLGDDFSLIHVLSVTTLVALVLSIVRIRAGNVAGHRRAMEAIYIGAVIAGAFTFIPGRLLGTLLFG